MIRWLKRSALALLVLILGALATVWWLLHGSLATLDGKVQLTGLSAPVDIERDSLGVVTIHAANETDAMRALGYVHAQERFFEMDLSRRSAAGELSELFGKLALNLDKKHRIHRFRAQVMDNLREIAGDKLPQLQAYTEGVNAGLADLKVRPWPYLVLDVKPQPWQLSDTALVGYSMYFELQVGDNERELALWKIKQHVPPVLWSLIARDGTSWDAPLQGAARGDAVLPDAATLDLRKLPMPDAASAKQLAETMSPGSNNFAVAGTATKDGRAILADDMHLGLRAPDIWFRARLQYADPQAPGGKVDIAGFTLPGIPAVVVGSNTHVAWGFTNSYGDYMDWFDACPWMHGQPRPACAAMGELPMAETVTETIHVKGEPDVQLPIVEDQFGPVIEDLPDGRALELFWIAHTPESLNLKLTGMARVGNLDDALRLTDSVAIPEQNLMLADGSGRIAWRLIGRVPERDLGCAPDFVHRVDAFPMVDDPPLPPDAKSRTPPEPAVHTCPWAMTPMQASPPVLAENPRLVQPPQGRLWTANNRTLDGEALARVGDDGYANGARAQQIRDDLFAKDHLAEKDLLAVQLDDRAVFLQRWWKLLQDASARARTPALHELATAAGHWDGRADPSSVSYRLVRTWRLRVLSRVRDGLLAPAEAALGKDFVMPELAQLEGVAWPMVTQRPDNLLSRRFAECAGPSSTASQCHGASGWDALFEDAARQVREDVGKYGPLAQRRWGERNTAAICHPLAGGLPSLFKRWLCMPPDELPGDNNMPRVASSDFGASERMVVSPGHEADGIIEMPGGQSGHPLSPFWGGGHEAWVRGEPTPFLPGKTAYTLKLVPAKR